MIECKVWTLQQRDDVKVERVKMGNNLDLYFQQMSFVSLKEKMCAKTGKFCRYLELKRISTKVLI